MSASVDIARNSRLPDFNRESYSGRVDVAREITPRVTIGFVADVQSALAIDLSRGLYSERQSSVTASPPGGMPPPTPTPGPGSDAGTGALLVPTARILIEDVGLSSSIRLSQASTLSGAAGFTRTDYASRALADGRAWNGHAALGRQMSSRFRVEGVLNAIWTTGSSSGSAVSGVQTMTLGGTWQIVPRISVRVNGGASRTTLDGLKPAIGGTGGVQVSALARRLAATLYVDRRAAPSFGLERIVASNAAGLTMVQTVGTATSISASVHHVQGSANVGSALHFSTTDYEAGIRQRLFGRVQLVSSAFSRQRSDVIAVQDVGVSVGFTVPLR